MNGSPPKIPKNAFPCRLASVIVRLSVSRSMASFSSTSTQQPWQRRLHELTMDTYRNGGKYSPRRMRRLNFSTDNMPITPKFQRNFAMHRLSAERSVRMTREGSMASSADRRDPTGDGCAFIDAIQRQLHADAGKSQQRTGSFQHLAAPAGIGTMKNGGGDAVLFDQDISPKRRYLPVGDGLLAAIGSLGFR